MELNRRRKQHVVIYKDARELFIRSKIDNKYLWLLNLLQQNFYERMYETDFEDTKDFDEKKINFILNVFPKYRDTIAQQWFRSSGMIIKEDGRCELCGKEHTKYMYKIKNIYNHNIMIVGSSCINNFGGINTFLPKGMSMEQFANQEKRRIKKLVRLEEFSRRFGNVNDLIKTWNYEYENLPLEVSYNNHLEIANIHARAKEIYKNYLNKSLSKDSLEEFDEIISLRKNVMIKISNAISRNSKDRFACPKSVGNWLIQNRKAGV